MPHGLIRPVFELDQNLWDHFILTIARSLVCVPPAWYKKPGFACSLVPFDSLTLNGSGPPCLLISLKWMPQSLETYICAVWFLEVALRVSTTNFDVVPAQLMKAFVWLSFSEYWKYKENVTIEQVRWYIELFIQMLSSLNIENIYSLTPESNLLNFTFIRLQKV